MRSSIRGFLSCSAGRTFVASEPSAFARYTKSFIGLQDREVAVITAKGHSLDDSRVKIADVEKPEVSPAPWPNWTIKGKFSPLPTGFI
jgi:glucosamine--fructose-6-phosphate aminotransferase (isomerizing)